MNVKLFRIFFLSLFIQFYSWLFLPCFAQTPAYTVQQCYDSTVGMNRPLTIGFAYMRIGYKTNGHPFFLTDSLLSCTLTYNQVIYRDLPVHFDIHQPALVTYDGSGNLLFSLIIEKIDSVEIDGRRFFPVNTMLDGKEGYELMELLETGKMNLYARHSKLLRKPAGPDVAAIPTFVERTEWLLQTESGWTKIESEKQLMQLGGKGSAAIKELIRKNNWSFRKEPGNTIRSVIHYLNNAL